ncbi:hypothetical protein MKX01_027116 [Papaver californicum]|nr:hypothetical protein MKX01_027116 [Papaver californicum]
MSNILETGLDRHTLSVLVALCEKGLNPESLAALVKELEKISLLHTLLNFGFFLKFHCRIPVLIQYNSL